MYTLLFCICSATILIVFALLVVALFKFHFTSKKRLYAELIWNTIPFLMLFAMILPSILK